MWGWKPVEGVIHNACSLDEARLLVREYKFHECVVNEKHIVFRKQGKTFYLDGRNASLELHLSECQNGLYMMLRYNDFVPFDTGDLIRFGDEIAKRLGKVEATAIFQKVPHYVGV